MHRQREQAVMALATDYVQEEADNTIESAIDIWKKLYYDTNGKGAKARGQNAGRRQAPAASL